MARHEFSNLIRRRLVLGDAVPVADIDVDGAVREGAVLGGLPEGEALRQLQRRLASTL